MKIQILMLTSAVALSWVTGDQENKSSTSRKPEGRDQLRSNSNISPRQATSSAGFKPSVEISTRFYPISASEVYGQPYGYYHQLRYSPGKPSVVYRHLNEDFNLKDAIRTRDRDPDTSHQHPKHKGTPPVPHISHHVHHRHHEYPLFYGPHEEHYYYPSLKPYQYDPTLTPECAFGNKAHYNLSFCVEDPHYPVEEIRHVLERNPHLVRHLLSDITYQSADNLVDGLTKAEEEGYTYEHYFGAPHDKHHGLPAFHAPYDGYTYHEEYYKRGGYICPSNIFYSRPKRARNTYGQWKIIVNLPGHEHKDHPGKGHHLPFEKVTQTQRIEQCTYPNAPCSYVDKLLHPRCIQKYNFVRLLAYTYEEGLHMDSFKMPVACSCHLSKNVLIPVHSFPIHPPHYPPDPHLFPHPHIHPKSLPLVSEPRPEQRRPSQDITKRTTSSPAPAGNHARSATTAKPTEQTVATPRPRKK